MNLNQYLRKTALFIIVAALSIGFIFPASSHAAERQPQKFPSRFSGIKNIPAEAMDTSFVESKDKKTYLTDEEINRYCKGDHLLVVTLYFMSRSYIHFCQLKIN